LSASPSALLLFRELAPAGVALAFARPRHLITATRISEVRAALDEVERLARSGLHAVGYVAYEAGPAFDDAIRAHAAHPAPLLHFALYDSPERIPAPRAATRVAPPQWVCETDEAMHAAAHAQIRETIAAGGVYQVNLTTRFRARWSGDGLALLLGMHARQRGGYTAWLDFGRWAIACASPELFVSRRGDVAVARPMKGTAARGRWEAEDRMLAEELSRSEKEQAENVMIVDLIRNDLGRVAVPGTVRVPKLYEVERYPSVWQLTSTVEADLRPGTSTADLIAALFPCGSITGAPKIAATRMIATLEQSPRGVYCGIVGHIAPSGDATFAVAIRTATIDREAETIEYGSGGGITWDSVAGAEHAELIAKAAIATAPWPRFDLLETMRVEQAQVPRLDRHLARLERSAARFDVEFRRDEVEAAVAAAIDTTASTIAAGGAMRLRLLLAADGTPRIEIDPLDRAPTGPLRAALAADPVSSADIFLHYKTTHRAEYDIRRGRRPDVDDVLLQNEAGELTEFTIGNLVLEIDGSRLTPPQASGLLPGVFREELLERGAVAERVLRPSDLGRAASVWLVNSLREWVPVQMVE
jgi:para-aminobenzoate synthetase / 4-amino-4-deoxychorismate lyase